MAKPGVLVFGEVGLVRSFLHAGIRVVAGTCHGTRSPASYCRNVIRRVRFSSAASKEFIDDLLAYGRTCGEPTYIATDDDEVVLAVSSSRQVLSPSYLFLLPPDPLPSLVSATQFVKRRLLQRRP